MTLTNVQLKGKAHCRIASRHKWGEWFDIGDGYVMAVCRRCGESETRGGG